MMVVSGERVAAGDDREAVGQFGERDVVNQPRRNRAALAVGQVAGGAALGVDRGAEAEIERGARGRAHAHMGHEAGEHQLLAAGRGQLHIELGAGEGVRQLLLDHDLAGPRLELRHDRAALRVAIEQAARRSLVRD
ncbi:hypothetical protein chiPu_0034009, partial [Chiloscyllium punctatum]|nr:hypothetical protein [Chiloscyllium punctatum]